MHNLFDFHLHTNVSDGSDTVEELYHKIKAANVHTFAVTDHDVMEGSLAMENLTENDPEITYIRGIEFSCTTYVKKCHILGYNFDPSDEYFLDVLAEGRRLRQEKTEKRIRFWEEELNIILTPEELSWLKMQKSPGKPTFGKIILDRGLAPDMPAAIKQFLNPCKIGSSRISAEKAIAAISHAGGISIWAHPLGGEGEKRLTKEEFYLQLDTLMKSGIHGLECYYSRYSQEDISFLVETANKYNLLISGGSDYHGTVKANLHIGKLSEDNMTVSLENLTFLDSLKSKKEQGL